MRGNVSEHSSKPLGGLFIHMVLDSTAETLKIQRKKQIKYKFTRNLSRQWVFCNGSSSQPHSRVSHSKFKRKCHWHSLFYKDHQNCTYKKIAVSLFACLSTSVLLATHCFAAYHSHATHPRSHARRLSCFAFFPRIFEQKRNCSQSILV